MPRVPARRTGFRVPGAGLAVIVGACVLMLCFADQAPAATGAHGHHRASTAARRLSATPPVPLQASRPLVTPARRSTATTQAAPTAAATSAPRLPTTGYDAATAALLGAALIAGGLGLRRLTADAGRR